MPLLAAVAQGFEPAAALLVGPRALSDALPLHPDPHLDHATDLSQCLRAEPRHPEQARALSIYLATVLDHGPNASTFAARVVVSTGSDDCSGVCAALVALAGPLHGGAQGPVLDMLDAVAQSAGAQAWIAAELQAGRRIMGMGHRGYRVRDPRAAALESALGGLDSPRLALAREAQAQAQLGGWAGSRTWPSSALVAACSGRGRCGLGWRLGSSRPQSDHGTAWAAAGGVSYQDPTEPVGELDWEQD